MTENKVTPRADGGEDRVAQAAVVGAVAAVVADAVMARSLVRAQS